MSLFRITFVPIEFFENIIRDKYKEEIKTSNSFTKYSDNQLCKIFKEFGGISPEVWQSTTDSDKFLAFENTSACFIKITKISEWKPSLQAIQEELHNRKFFHNQLINENSAFGLNIQELTASVKHKSGYDVKINYAFSTYIYKSIGHIADADINLFKLLAEPSLIDLDDMLSSDHLLQHQKNFTSLAEKTVIELEKIHDVDLSPDAITFITWASVVLIDKTTKNCDSTNLRDIIIALETKLQMIWNKCSTFSSLAESVLTNNSTKQKILIDDFYWQLAQTFDDAQGAISATTSSRVNKIYDKMIETSKVQAEILKLDGKIRLLDKFIRARNEKGDRRYRKAIEILLFITALGQIAPSFFEIPKNPVLGSIVIGGACLIGLFSIIIRKA